MGDFNVNIIKNGEIEQKINDRYFFISKEGIAPITYNQYSIISNKHFERRDLYSIKILNDYYLSFEENSLKQIKSSFLEESFRDYWNFYLDCVEKEGVKPSEAIYYISRELSAKDFKMLCLYFKYKGLNCLDLLKQEVSEEAFEIVSK